MSKTCRAFVAVLSLATIFAPSSALAEDFPAGSLIIPMDIDYQDMGMFEAYGLVYELLRNDVPVDWVIKEGKPYAGVDFMASAVDHQTGDPIDGHGYRGGPWVIAAEHADAAFAIIDGWQEQSPNVVVHEATSPFSGDVAHTLIHAPSIAMMADGNQKIARKYMLAARIPDSVGDYTWPDESPDMLDPDEVAGPTDEEPHDDGALFDEDGDPVYCQFMSMHWGIGDAEDKPEVVAEVRRFLGHPTHFFAECQAVNAFENLAPHGFYLTDSGFLIGDRPDAYDFFQTDTPFAQLDGPFESVGGSEPAYSLPEGTDYKSSDIVMITEKDTPIGVNDVWMTGLLDGSCRSSQGCLNVGKVSYLGGHEYKTDVPVSQNPDAQGTRLFLNSLFEAPCGTVEGTPQLLLDKQGPSFTDVPEVTYQIEYKNEGPFTALDVVLFDTLPVGAVFVSGSAGVMIDGDQVAWELGNLGSGEGGSVELTISLADYGVHANIAHLEYLVGVNTKSFESNMVVTQYSDMPTTTSGTDSDGPDSTDGSATAGPTSGDSNSGTGATASGTDTGTDSATTGDSNGSGATTEDGASATDTAGEDAPAGCSCRAGGPFGGTAWFMLLPLVLLRRRS